LVEGDVAYQLNAGEHPMQGLQRILLEIVDTAVTELTTAPDGPHQAVHNTRKGCKRIRAALRLGRAALGETVYAHENAFVRDASRRLSAVRDSKVIVDAFDAAAANFAGALPAPRYAAIRAQLVSHHEDTSRQILEERGGTAVVAQLLQQFRDRVAALPTPAGDFTALAPGLERVYRRARQARDHAYAANRPEVFHEWRKQVKYLWHQLEILQPAWPAHLDSLAKALHQLSDFLGDAHDLHELARTLQDAPERFGEDGELTLLLALLEQWRAEFEAAARPSGARLFSEPPDAFVARMAAYWEAWRTLGPPADGPVLDEALALANPAPLPEQLLSTRAAAARLGLSPRQVRARIRSGALPAARIGNVWVIQAADLEAP
jgi:excisionase family DNA binding protein